MGTCQWMKWVTSRLKTGTPLQQAVRPIMIIVSGSPKSQQHMICETMIRMFSTSKTCQKMMRYKVKREKALFENMCIIISYRE